MTLACNASLWSNPRSQPGDPRLILRCLEKTAASTTARLLATRTPNVSHHAQNSQLSSESNVGDSEPLKKRPAGEFKVEDVPIISTYQTSASRSHQLHDRNHSLTQTKITATWVEFLVYISIWSISRSASQVPEKTQENYRSVDLGHRAGTYHYQLISR
ncbi:hypothetical protein RRG08_030380 [Elysia crispata]|uniref:Uncharacterized protein n=1 Tax=Elysia crispata TaxID=231223 RepID=A0AAE0YFR9_9GAST|nr:hypothetical protein RRG08_030380 [Elysia crispata]